MPRRVVQSSTPYTQDELRGRANPAVTVFRNVGQRHPVVKVHGHRRDLPRKPKRARKNPSAVVLSRRAVSLAYLHAESAPGSRRGQAYIHKFGRGVSVQLLSDGSVRLFRPDRKPLWKHFED